MIHFCSTKWDTVIEEEIEVEDVVNIEPLPNQEANSILPLIAPLKKAELRNIQNSLFIDFMDKELNAYWYSQAARKMICDNLNNNKFVSAAPIQKSYMFPILLQRNF